MMFDVLKKNDTKMNDWLLKMNDKYFLDLRSNSSEELQRNEFKNMRPEIDRREYTSSECASLNLSKENSFKSRKLYRKDYSSEKLLRNSPTLPYQNLTINAYFRMINGNRGCSYNIGMWNCRKGLIDGENQATYKMVEVKKFIEEHNLHLLCLVEAGLHGPASRIRRTNPITTQGIMSNLQIEGYRIILPKTWQYHNQARIILFAKDDLKVTEKVTPTL